MAKKYLRKPLFDALWRALRGEPNLIQVITGPRQVGKTTLALQVLEKWPGGRLYQTADLPSTPSSEWIVQHWREARTRSRGSRRAFLLVLDEVQKIPRWSEAVKMLFDADRVAGRRLRVVTLGSSALLMQRGLAESLAGRFEVHRHGHWSFSECRDYFSLRLDEYLYFGGYPSALPLRKDQARWSRYIRDSLIETVLSKDVVLMMPVTKPALLRQIFGLATMYPAQVLSYQKMLGQLQDAGNTTTVASYIRLLSNAFLVTALERWSGSRVRQRGSIPKLLVMDNALISATAGRSFAETRRDTAVWGRLLENAVGARLYAALQERGARLYYWRERQEEVDYVVQVGERLKAVEVKLSIAQKAQSGLRSFARRYRGAELIVLAPGRGRELGDARSVTLEEFFENPLTSIGMR